MGRKKRNQKNKAVAKPAASAAVVKKKMTPEENRRLPAKEKKEFQNVVVRIYTGFFSDQISLWGTLSITTRYLAYSLLVCVFIGKC